MSYTISASKYKLYISSDSYIRKKDDVTIVISTIYTSYSRSLVGAWIETFYYITIILLLLVAPSWERGLKQELDNAINELRESLPRGSVD